MAPATATTSRRCWASGRLPPYYHNGACETLNCVLANVTASHGERHRARSVEQSRRSGAGRRVPAEPRRADGLPDESAASTGMTSSSIRRRSSRTPAIVVGANVSLFGTRADLEDISNTLKVKFTLDGAGRRDVHRRSAAARLHARLRAGDGDDDLDMCRIRRAWHASRSRWIAPTVFAEANENDNTAARNVLVRTPPPDTTPPVSG